MFSIARKMVIVILFYSVFPSQTALAEDVAYTDREIIRNGDFEEDLYTAWYDYRCYIASYYARDGDNGLRLQTYTGDDDSDDRYVFQQLTIPSELDSARIRFDYRAVENSGFGVDRQPVVLEVSIAKSSGFDSENLEEVSPLTLIEVIYTERIEAEFDWRVFEAELDPAAIQGIQAAHDNGEFVFLQISQMKTDANERHGFATDIDNLSLTVNGRQHLPELGGKIAYFANDAEFDPRDLNILDPDTFQVETIWTDPRKNIVLPERDVVWRPDATEIAFVSAHEIVSSPIDADIYAIRPDGGGLRKVTELLQEFDRSTIDLGELVPRELTWRHDGSEIGFRMFGFYKIPADPSDPFLMTEVQPSGSPFGACFTWSPVDDRYLYNDAPVGKRYDELYIAEEGGEPRLLVEHNEWNIPPAWLPDGSGFVYIGIPGYSPNATIYFYDLGSGQMQRLTYFHGEVIERLSTSPNGQYIVFELRNRLNPPYRSDLWIMDRLNPVEIWRITDSGNCTAPKWSPTDAPGATDGGGDGSSDSGGGGGGGGGCFISALDHRINDIRQ
jgi:hypothetical protein